LQQAKGELYLIPAIAAAGPNLNDDKHQSVGLDWANIRKVY
jgi:hypothetical protein